LHISTLLNGGGPEAQEPDPATVVTIPVFEEIMRIREFS
jgi:hypothetical protein